LSRLGGWLFRHRTALPVPVVLAIVIIPPGSTSWPRALTVVGMAISLAGEALRLWAVRHIGAISRTRSDRLGPLVSTGPFALVRNPLYVGNLLLWVGFTLAARLVWLAPIVLVLVCLEYAAIVRWEERLLEERLGEPYRRYVATVPRWIPAAFGTRPSGQTRDFAAGATPRAEYVSWADTFFSERGTLIAIAAGYLLLWLKARS
jgi:protein-S-isoprenylcysteine O-methyltransferase Ste14